MELRYCLALVTRADDPLGRSIAVALAREGVAVLAAGPDAAEVDRTVALVAGRHARGWGLQCDLAHPGDVQMLTARADDLGGADLLVDVQAGAGDPACSRLLLEGYRAGLATRRGRRQPGAVVVVTTDPSYDGAGLVPDDDPTRLMTVVLQEAPPPGGPNAPDAPDGITGAVSATLELLRRGTAGQRVVVP